MKTKEGELGKKKKTQTGPSTHRGNLFKDEEKVVQVLHHGRRQKEKKVKIISVKNKPLKGKTNLVVVAWPKKGLGRKGGGKKVNRVAEQEFFPSKKKARGWDIPCAFKKRKKAKAQAGTNENYLHDR